ncbi:hypothetical protein EC988_000003 [Linderina pennispora]|nr:hypothetical protein EC988_000003 [Linderina pennispora]
MSTDIIPNEWKFAFVECEKLMQHNLECLSHRRRLLQSRGIRIFPSDEMLFESLHMIAPQEVRLVVVLPRPYPFDSGTGIPCMIRGDIGVKPRALQNIQKIFKTKDNDFEEVWKQGALLCNISQTEEEPHDNKIPHEIFWSLVFESLLKYLSLHHSNIVFCFTGSGGNKYKKFVDLSQGHAIVELPSIADSAFVERFEAEVCPELLKMRARNDTMNRS